MCCFNQPVDHVNATRIFVGQKAGFQVTVYAASIIGHRIEMVLPVRTRGATDLEWINLKGNDSFFRNCELASRKPTRAAWEKSTTRSMGAASSAMLEVKQVGDYQVSFAPTWRDLDRVDPRVFKLSERLAAVVREHYPTEEFGFVIYRPDKSGEMHPLAYRHPLRGNDSLFVPTRHEHGHEGPPDWDHYLYHQEDVSQNIPASLTDGGEEPARRFFQWAKSKGKPLPAELDLDRRMFKIERQGSAFPNGDLAIRRTSQTADASVVGAVGAAAVVGAGASYLLRRRSLNRKPAE